MKIKIRKADKLFSDYIRTRDGWTCKVCRTGYPVGSRGLHNSHFHGRRKENTRYDPLNCDAICMHDHQNFHENPLQYVEWKRKQLGETEFQKLNLRAEILTRRDDQKAILYCENLLKSQEILQNSF